jgi:hypothetical protein
MAFMTIVTTPLRAAVAVSMLLGQGAVPATPDFSGRWQLVTASEHGKPIAATSDTTAAPELVVTRNATSMTVAHEFATATHPKAAIHRFLSHGTVGRGGTRSSSHVFWFGDQLVITSSSREPEHGNGRYRIHEYSEKWLLDAGGQLIVDFSETRSEGASTWGTLVYRRADGR